MIASFREKISFGMSAMVYEFEAVTVISYIALFCTDVMYLKAGAVGLIIFLVRVLDMISNAFIVNLADKTETRWGKYRPYILFSGIPLALCVVLLFWNPVFLTTYAMKIFWVAAIYFLMVPIFETAYMCPMMILGTVMSPDSEDRLAFATARTLGENITDFIINGSAMTIILMFGSYHNLVGWRVMALIYAAVMVICSLIGFSGIKERVVCTTKNDDGSHMTLKEKVLLLKGDYAFFKLLGIQFGLIFAWTGTMVMFNYFCIYVLGHEDWVAVLSTTGIVFQLLTSVTVSRLARKFEKRTLVFIGSIMFFAASFILIFTNSFAAAVVYQIFRGIGVGLIYICTWSMWPDATDHLVWKTGVVAPGIIITFASIEMKFVTALVTYGSMLLLVAGHYNAKLTAQTLFTMNWLRYGMVTLLFIGGLIVLLSNFKLKELTKPALIKYTREIAIKGLGGKTE